MRRNPRIIVGLMVAAMALFAYWGSSSVNPTTGETQHVSITPEQEVALGLQARNVLGGNKKKPRYNAVLQITSDRTGEAQAIVQKVLDDLTKRWKLDEVIGHEGKPDEICYLVRLGKSMTRDELITAIRARAEDRVTNAELEIGEAVDREKQEKSA